VSRSFDMPRDKYNSRQGPSDLEDVPLKAVLEFDIQRPWPQRYFNQRFGPALIRKALSSGLLVFAEVPDIPYPIAIKEVRWAGEILEVVTLEGPRIVARLFTRKSMKGVTCSGFLLEKKETG
jgi:hypothetical protein